MGEAWIYLIVAVVLMIGIIGIGGPISYFSYRNANKKEIKLDISFKQMKEREICISNFLKENNLPHNASLDDVAKVLKVQKGSVSASLEDQAQISEPNEKGEMIVTFKSGLTKHDKIFAFAHECAHRINEDPIPNSRPDSYNKSEEDQLADYTAAALLMPREAVYKDLNEYDFKNLSFKNKMKTLRNICEKYKVNEIVALRRIEEVYRLEELDKSAGKLC